MRFKIEVYDNTTQYGIWKTIHTIRARSEEDALKWARKIYGKLVRVEKVEVPKKKSKKKPGRKKKEIQDEEDNDIGCW